MLAALPQLVPRLPAAGQKARAAVPVGSADALALAQLAAALRRREAAARGRRGRRARSPTARRRAALVRARPSRRAPPRLGDASLRSFLAAPGPGLAAARHAPPRLARRMRRARRRGDDGALPARAAGISRGVHVLPEAGHAARRRRAARPARPRRLPARHAGRLARRVQRARRTDRPLSDGKSAAVPPRSLRRRHREHQDLRRRHATHALPRAQRAPPPRARVSAGRGGPRSLSHAFPRSLRGRSVAFAAVQGREQRRRAGRHRVLPASVLRETATLADYLPRDAVVAFVGDVAGAVERFWQDTDSRYKLLRGDKSRPLLPPTSVFLPPDAFHGALKAHARDRDSRRRRRIRTWPRRAPDRAAAAGRGRPAGAGSARRAESATSRPAPRAC